MAARAAKQHRWRRELITGDFAPAPTGRHRERILEYRGKQLSALSATATRRWQVITDKRLATILHADSTPSATVRDCPQVSAMAGGLGRLGSSGGFPMPVRMASAAMISVGNALSRRATSRRLSCRGMRSRFYSRSVLGRQGGAVAALPRRFRSLTCGRWASQPLGQAYDRGPPK